MKRLLGKASAVVLAMIMAFSQSAAVFADNIAAAEPAGLTIESKARAMLREEMKNNLARGMDSQDVTTNAVSREQKVSTVEKAALIEDSGLKKASLEKSSDTEIVPDQIIVKYKSGTTSKAKSALSAKLSAVSEENVEKLRLSHIRLPKGSDIESALEKLEADPSVEYAEPVYVRKASALSSIEYSGTVVESVYCSEPYYTKGWQWGLEAMNLDSMWASADEQELSKVTIAVVDSGVDMEHEEFTGRIVGGYDFVNNDSNADDDNGHGTHVAGIAAAANDSKGIAGVAGSAKIMPVKVLDEWGSGDTAEEINGILFAVNNGADIINLSLCGRHKSKAEEAAVKYALDHGVTVIASAGNDHDDWIYYPAAYEGVISVGSVDWDAESEEFVKADFSNISPELDLLTPGVDILSTVPMELDSLKQYISEGIGDNTKDGYTVMSGTSMSAPFASGMAALILAGKPGLDCTEVLQELKERSTDYYDPDDGYIPVLNGGSALKAPFSFKHVDFDSGIISDTGSVNLKFSVTDCKSTVSDSVYGKLNVMMGEYGYSDDIYWIEEPQKVKEIEIVDGTASTTIATELGKNYIFYAEGSDAYLPSNAKRAFRDGNDDFEEAKEIKLGIQTNDTIGKPREEDYFWFDIITAGYYIIEGIGEIDTYGTLYKETGYMDYEYVADNDDNEYGWNFRIDRDDDENLLMLYPGRYCVCVEGFEAGAYGVVVNKRGAISGKVAFPSGINSAGDTKIDMYLIERELNGDGNGYNYFYVDYVTVKILDGKNYATYSIPIEPEKDYIIEYDLYDTGSASDYTYLGYYGTGGTVVSVKDAEIINTGKENVDITLVPTSTIADDNDFNSAPALVLGGTINGRIDYDGDIDFYELTIPTAGYYSIGITALEEIRQNDGAGYLFDSLGGDLDAAGYGVGPFDGVKYTYGTYYLEPGTYYYAATNYIYPFYQFEHKVMAAKTSLISGRVSLPGGLKSDFAKEIPVSVEISKGDTYVFNGYIPYGNTSLYYYLGVPSDTRCYVSYDIGNDRYKFESYAQKGYYSTSGTTISKATATAIDLSSSKSDINFEFVPLTDLDNDSKETATAISTGAWNNGHLEGEGDEDYFKFTVPQEGKYLIETLSEDYESVEVYIETDDKWILFDEESESSIEWTLNAGTYYIKICSEGNEYVDYSVRVSSRTKPSAANVSVYGTAMVGYSLTGSYTYSDIEQDKESGSTYRWLRSDTSTGEYTAITGATLKNYILTSTDQGKYIKFEVTPKTTAEPTTGAAVQSGAIGPVAAETTNPSNGGGGSHGGGGGGGGGSSNTPAPNTTTEQTQAGSATVTKGTDGKTTVEIKVDSTKLGSALAASGSTPVTIDVNTKSNPDNLDVNIPSSVFGQAAQAGKPVVVNSNNVDFSFQPGTFDAGSLNGNVKLEVSQLTIDSVPDALKKMNPSSDEVSLVFDFGLSIGGNKITDFNQPVTITIKFDPSKVTDLSKVGVYYYNEKNGTWEYVGGKANPDGTITFTVDHFSKYMAMEYKKTFADISKHWAKADIELLMAKHVARSQSETSFAPDSNITRAAFASMIVRALDIRDNSSAKNFKDIASGAWYAEDVYKAYTAGIIEGVSSTEFAPDQMITREQMATMLMKAYERATGKKLDGMTEAAKVNFSDESSISGWAKRNVVLANTVGLVAGNPDGSYNPKGNMTKAQAVVVIKRLMEKLNRL